MRVVTQGRRLAGYLKDIPDPVVAHDHLKEYTIGVELSGEEACGVEPVEYEIGVDIGRDGGMRHSAQQRRRFELYPVGHLKDVRSVQIKILTIDLYFLPTLLNR